MISAIAPSKNTAASAVDPRLPKAAQDFEAMLLADLMKMGKADDTPDGDSDRSLDGYDDLRNQAVAAALASKGGIGIGRMMVAGLGSSSDIKASSFSADSQIAGIYQGDASK